ncbi:ankyrin repeat domain-containing protein [uncultured Nitratireductor sp.]|uniref:ankyrin repeat domain-containing protein n=1 Tax=uncultured Nitratireductor sp. TaxID=520953 RepID=UPI0025E71423|nr:ankyrin repeat domain-containing protein [uncultured Nitratireductor sp.]
MRKLSIWLAAGSVLLLSGIVAHSQEAERQIQQAVRGNDVAGLRQLLEKGVDFTRSDRPQVELMAMAAAQATPEIIEVLARNGVDINRADSEGYTPVMRALEAGRIENALALHNLGAELKGVTEDGYTVRVLAEIAGLEDFGPEYASRPRNASQEELDQLLLLAAESGDVAAARFALDSGASLDTKVPANGWSAVMLAALSGNPEIVEFLSTKGALGADDQPWETVGEGVDVVVAALVGEGGPEQDHDRAAEILGIVKQHRPVVFQKNTELYRQKALNIGYPTAFVRRHFPLIFLQPVDFRIPSPIRGGPDGWRELQMVLKEAGFYDAKVDGVPGRMTLAALSRYGVSRLKALHDSCATAARRALDEFDIRTSATDQAKDGLLYIVAAAANAASGAGKIWLGEFRVAGRHDNEGHTALTEAGFVLELAARSGLPTGDMICKGGPFDIRYYGSDPGSARISFDVIVPDGTVRFTIHGQGIQVAWQGRSGTIRGEHQLASPLQDFQISARTLHRIRNLVDGRICSPNRQPIQHCRTREKNGNFIEIIEDEPGTWECGVNLAGVHQCKVGVRQ